MSNEALTWAFRQTEVKPGPRFVLVVLADMADERHSCFPSVATIASRTGYSERAVKSHLLALTELGLVQRVERWRENGSQRSNRFVLSVGASPGGVQNLHPGNICTPGGAESAPLEPLQVTPTERDSLRARAQEAFAELWAAWPRKEDKKLATERWHRLASQLPIERLRHVYGKALEHAAVYNQWPPDDQRFVPYFAHWLSRARYDDEGLPLPKSGSLTAVDAGRVALEELRRRKAAREAGGQA